MSQVNPTLLTQESPQINLSLVTFVMICIIFILSAISYMKLSRTVPVEDLPENGKKAFYESQNIVFWVMFFTGLTLLLFGYMILYYPKENNTVMYLGTEQCSSETCSDIGDISVDDYQM